MALPILLALLLIGTAARASGVGVVGLFPGKAVLVVDGAGPKTYAVGAVVSYLGVTYTAGITGSF